MAVLENDFEQFNCRNDLIFLTILKRYINIYRNIAILKYKLWGQQKQNTLPTNKMRYQF